MAYDMIGNNKQSNIWHYISAWYTQEFGHSVVLLSPFRKGLGLKLNSCETLLSAQSTV